MHEAICTNCQRDVQITPDAEFCSACGENLKFLIPKDKMSQYFYDRASKLAETASISAALSETQRGLEQIESSELQLLAAILAESEGEYELMRQYVSLIPVSDRLRDEGEWLLRSRQARQGARRLGTLKQVGEPTKALPSTASWSDGLGRFASGQDQPPVDDMHSIRTRRIGQHLPDTQIVGPAREPARAITPVNILDPSQGARRMWPAAIALLLLIGLVWSGWQFLGGGITGEQQASGEQPSAVEPETNSPAGTVEGTTENRAEPQVTVTNLQPTDTPSNDVPANVVDGESGSSPVAGSAGQAVQAGVSRPYELTDFLLERGRSDLAAFRLDALLQNNELIISGAVDTSAQRRDIMALAETTSDLVTVIATDLVVRQPDTYIIEAGDTLWLIADKLYDDGERWNDIYEANQDILASPDAIIVGQELTIPQNR